MIEKKMALKSHILMSLTFMIVYSQSYSIFFLMLPKFLLCSIFPLNGINYLLFLNHKLYKGVILQKFTVIINESFILSDVILLK